MENEQWILDYNTVHNGEYRFRGTEDECTKHRTFVRGQFDIISSQLFKASRLVDDKLPEIKHSIRPGKTAARDTASMTSDYINWLLEYHSRVAYVFPSSKSGRKQGDYVRNELAGRGIKIVEVQK